MRHLLPLDFAVRPSCDRTDAEREHACRHTLRPVRRCTSLAYWRKFLRHGCATVALRKFLVSTIEIRLFFAAYRRTGAVFSAPMNSNSPYTTSGVCARWSTNSKLSYARYAAVAHAICMGPFLDVKADPVVVFLRRLRRRWRWRKRRTRSQRLGVCTLDAVMKENYSIGAKNMILAYLLSIVVGRAFLRRAPRGWRQRRRRRHRGVVPDLAHVVHH